MEDDILRVGPASAEMTGKVELQNYLYLPIMMALVLPAAVGMLCNK